MRLLTTLLLISIALSANSQTTNFYKNIFGAYGTVNFQDAPLINSLEKLSNNNYFVTSSENPYAGYFSCAKLDSNFSPIWTRSYLPSAGGPTNMFDQATELDDGSIVTTGISNDRFVFTKFDTQGNLEFSKYYGASASDDYVTSAIVHSNVKDTGYVALFAQCAVQFGIFKFNKDGDVMWGHEYSIGGPYNGSIYDLNHGLNGGYICRGMNAGASLKRGLLLVTKEDGSLKVCKEYGSNNPNYAYAVPDLIFPSKMDTSYYVNMNYALPVTQGSPNQYEVGFLAKLDTNLAVVKNWHITHPDPNIEVRIRNIASTNDGMLIINGELYDPVNYPRYQFFLMKFDPTAASNNSVWVKTFRSISSNQTWHDHLTVDGLFINGPDNQIIMPMVAHRDGSAVMSLDEDANLMCNFTDITLNVTEDTGLEVFSNNLTYSTQAYTMYDNTLVPYLESHSDTILCGINPVGISEIFEQKELVEITSEFDALYFENLSGESINVEIYNLQGQLVSTLSIDAYSKERIPNTATGILTFIALQQDGSQRGKFYQP